MGKIRIGAKILIFLAIVLALLVGVNYVVQPIWTDWNMRNTTYGYYEDPTDTVETLFLGSSASTVGISPMQLYEDYGICSYNAGTESQPLMASYYLAEEFERLNPATLDTIVLEVSTLRETPLDTMYIKVLDSLKWSPVKFRFLWDFSDNFSDFLSHAIPLLSYHDRWEELSAEDFQKSSYELATYTRGYYFVTDNRLARAADPSEIPLPNTVVQSDEQSVLDEEALTYLDRLIAFCDEHGIGVTLVKTPQDDWTDADHNATEALAEDFGLDFFDFNYEPLLSEVDYDGGTDRMDEKHLNYYGATNLTDWMGEYLMEERGNRDVRGNSRYAFMEAELTDYHREILSTELEQIANPADYLADLMAEDEYAILISAKGDAANTLTEEQRRVFAELGLTELADLSLDTAYLAVIDDGEITEYSVPEDEISAMEESDETDVEETDAPVLSLDGTLADGSTYAMTSGALAASIQIDETEYSRWLNGLNIVVYDEKLGLIVDRTAFDTSVAPYREI